MKARIFAMLALALNACISVKVLQLGDIVQLSYILENTTKERIDGTLLPNNSQLSIRLKIGEKQLFTEVDTALIGMQIGQEKTIVIHPENNYGKMGVFYKNATEDTVYIIKPDEQLYLHIKVIAEM